LGSFRSTIELRPLVAPGKPSPALAGEARLELATPGFGDRCSAN
jgi:hypothetical protein